MWFEEVMRRLRQDLARGWSFGGMVVRDRQGGAGMPCLVGIADRDSRDRLLPSLQDWSVQLCCHQGQWSAARCMSTPYLKQKQTKI
jgi:hypothetical protein